MNLRPPVVAFALTALLTGAVPARASEAQPDAAADETSPRLPVLPDAASQLGIDKIKGLSLGFFSSLSGTEFGHFSVEEIAPATRKHGPFRLPAIGFAITRPRLVLNDTPCSPKDWAALLQTLKAFAQVPSSGNLELQLPDGETSQLGTRYQVGADTITALLPQPEGSRLLLRISHDGDTRLRIERHSIPGPRTFPPHL